MTLTGHKTEERGVFTGNTKMHYKKGTMERHENVHLDDKGTISSLSGGDERRSKSQDDQLYNHAFTHQSTASSHVGSNKSHSTSNNQKRLRERQEDVEKETNDRLNEHKANAMNTKEANDRLQKRHDATKREYERPKEPNKITTRTYKDSEGRRVHETREELGGKKSGFFQRKNEKITKEYEDKDGNKIRETHLPHEKKKLKETFDTKNRLKTREYEDSSGNSKNYIKETYGDLNDGEGETKTETFKNGKRHDTLTLYGKRDPDGIHKGKTFSSYENHTRKGLDHSGNVDLGRKGKSGTDIIKEAQNAANNEKYKNNDSQKTVKKAIESSQEDDFEKEDAFKNTPSKLTPILNPKESTEMSLAQFKNMDIPTSNAEEDTESSVVKNAASNATRTVTESMGELEALGDDL